MAPPIYAWREPVDDKFVALHASVRIVRRGVIYGAAVWMIHEVRPRYTGRWRDQMRTIEAKLRQTIRDQHGGRLPTIGRASALPDGYV